MRKIENEKKGDKYRMRNKELILWTKDLSIKLKTPYNGNSISTNF